MYLTFQDTEGQLVAMGTAMGCDMAAACASGQVVISRVPVNDLDLDHFASSVRTELARKPTARVVIDSLAELVTANRESERFPAYKRSLLALIRAAGSSVLATSETTTHGITGQTLDALMYLFDNVISLRYVEHGPQVGRAINVAKMRNSRHETTLNSFEITDHGPAVGDTLEGVSGFLGWSALRADQLQAASRAEAASPPESALGRVRSRVRGRRPRPRSPPSGRGRCGPASRSAGPR